MNARAQVPSPEATGGSGMTFEARVGAIALGRLLRGDRVPGLNLAPSRVRLQQRVAGAVLDDIVLDARQSRNAAAPTTPARPVRAGVVGAAAFRDCLASINRAG